MYRVDRSAGGRWTLLDLDSISYPKGGPTYTPLRDSRNDQVVFKYTNIQSGPLIAQANASQRFWFVNYVGSNWLSEVENAFSVEVTRQQRYFSLRGAR